MRPFLRMGFFAVVAACTLSGIAKAEGQSHYKLVKTIELPGKGGHGDWVVYDPAFNKVWLAQGPNHSVVVIDANDLKVKATIGGIEDGNGIALNDRYAFVADATANKLVVIDKTSYKQVASVDTGGKGSDGVSVDTHAGRVYVGNDDSDTESVFMDRPPFKKIGDIALTPNPAKHGPDVNLFVPSLSRVYQPVDNVVDVIDPKTQKVEAVWDFNLKKEAKPMVYDTQGKHLIIGSRDKKILVADPDGKLVSSIPFDGGNIDQIAIDVSARRIFLGDKSGQLEVIDLDTNQVVDHLPAEKDTHTLTVDPRTHRIFVYLDSSNKVAVFEPA